MVFRLSLRTLIFLASGFVIASFVTSALRVLPDPNPTPMESVLLEQAGRMAHHQPPYAEPAPYGEPSSMPGMPFAATLLAMDQEPQLWHIRVLSLAAALSVVLLAGAIVYLESSSWTLTVASGSFVLIGLGFLTALPGVARPEPLMFLLVLLGFSLLRFTYGVWGAFSGALPLAAAFFVDQQAAWFIAAAYVSLAVEDRNRLVAFALMTALVAGGGYVWLSQMLGPWFNFNAWDEPFRMLRFSPVGALRFVSEHLLGKLGVWTLAALLSFAMPTQPWWGKSGIWMCMGVAALASGLLSSQSSGFGPASLIPVVVVLSLLGPIMVQRIARHLAEWSDPDKPGGEGVVLAALALQFLAILSAVPITRLLSSALGIWHRPL